MENLVSRMAALAHTDWALLPIQYDQLLGSELEDTAFHHLNFPCIQRERLQRALRVQRSKTKPWRGLRGSRLQILKFKALIKQYKSEFEAAHGSPPQIQTGPKEKWCSNQFQSANGTLDTSRLPPCAARMSAAPEKTWFYLQNQLVPIVFNRRWPFGTAFTTGGSETLPNRWDAWCSE